MVLEERIGKGVDEEVEGGGGQKGGGVGVVILIPICNPDP